VSDKHVGLDERLNQLYVDVAKICGVIDEMGDRLTDQSKSLRTLNHNSTSMATTIARLEVKVDNNTSMIKNLKKEISDNIKLWLTVFSIAVSIITFIINYYRV